MRALIDKITTPPGGYTYRVPETGVIIRHVAHQEWVAQVRRHYTANNLQPPDDLILKMEDQLCQSMPAGICTQVGQVPYVDRSLGFDHVIAGTKTIIGWMTAGFSTIPKAEADKRAVVCASCPYNKPIEGCVACRVSALIDTVRSVAGAQVTDGDHYLHGCQMCGCSLKAKVWVPLEVLRNHVTVEQNTALPEWCWLKTPP